MRLIVGFHGKLARRFRRGKRKPVRMRALPFVRHFAGRHNADVGILRCTERENRFITRKAGKRILRSDADKGICVGTYRQISAESVCFKSVFCRHKACRPAGHALVAEVNQPFFCLKIFFVHRFAGLAGSFRRIRDRLCHIKRNRPEAGQQNMPDMRRISQNIVAFPQPYARIPKRRARPKQRFRVTCRIERIRAAAVAMVSHLQKLACKVIFFVAVRHNIRRKRHGVAQEQYPPSGKIRTEDERRIVKVGKHVRIIIVRRVEHIDIQTGKRKLHAGACRYKRRAVCPNFRQQRIKDFMRVFYVEFVRDNAVYKTFKDNIVLMLFPKAAEHRCVVVMHMRDKPRRNHRLFARALRTQKVV